MANKKLADQNARMLAAAGGISMEITNVIMNHLIACDRDNPEVRWGRLREDVEKLSELIKGAAEIQERDRK